jgi:UDP-glucose 4-epimerase
MQILIFGGKGFIGSSFVNGLKNAEISVIDNIELLTKEILQNCDLLINCAGASNVSASFLDPQNDFINNTILVQQLLEKIRLLGCLDIRFITISSAAVYGTPKLLPIKVNEDLKPISPYGYHKMFAEDICKMYYRCFGIKSISLRIFSAYGNRQTKLLMWDLFQKFTDNSKSTVELFGTGKETRDFIHIDDIIRQIELVIANARFKGEAINIGNGTEISIFNVAKIFQECLNSKKEIKFNNIVREGDPLNWCADIGELIKWGYNQQVNLETGIMLYIKSNLNEKSI